jgi:hypothetical protein
MPSMNPEIFMAEREWSAERPVTQLLPGSPGLAQGAGGWRRRAVTSPDA